MLLAALCCASAAGVRSAAAELGPTVRRYTGTVGSYPITMTLERQGARLNGHYRYVRKPMTLRLEGTVRAGLARLEEIYGAGTRTATITARLMASGEMDGVWTKLGSSKPLAFHAWPLGPVVATAPAQRITPRSAPVGALRAHRSSSSGTVRRAPHQATAAGSRDPDAELLRAAQRGDTEAARYLLDGNADPEVRDAAGRTSLILACIFRNDASEATSFASMDERISFVRLLLARGAQVDAADKRGYTALMYAAASWGAGNPIIRILLDANADVNAQNNYRGTALMVATGKFGHVSTVQLLVDAGANLDLRDKFGHTALWYARAHRADASIRVLERAGAAE